MRRRSFLIGGALVLAGCSSGSPSPAPSRGPVASQAPASPSSVAASPSASPSASRDPEKALALMKALSAGGVVLYLRHPATDRGGTDSAALPREEQRLLSPLGEDQAAKVGGAFSSKGAKVDEVFTSPLWRCQDAARIAFGEYRVEPLLEGLLAEVSSNTDEARINFSLEKLRAPVPEGKVRVLIGHTSNIVQSTGQRIEEASGVVALPDGKGSFEVLGVLTADDWTAFASE